jgi:phosphatidylglycerophosphate synthase
MMIQPWSDMARAIDKRTSFDHKSALSSKKDPGRLLTIVGECDQRLFGMKPAERLTRQTSKLGDMHLVAHASAVLSDDTISWLADHPGTVVSSSGGRLLATVVGSDQLAMARQAIKGDGGLTIASADAIGPVYVRKLRRTLEPLALALGEQPRAKIERKLFASVYKGVTDVVTKYAWPEPALWLTRAAAGLGLTPNTVTVAGLLLTLVAGWQFYVGNLAAGMVAAWLMTLLDTVDGKLARVTLTSSEFGNLLDHGNDLIHPPLWWLCLAYGIGLVEPDDPWIWPACWIILMTYFVGRVLEKGFKARFGFNPFMWQRFDSRFRMIISRRNIILLIMTFGLILRRPAEAFAICAAWSVLSVLIQAGRYAQAYSRSRRAPINAWLG